MTVNPGDIVHADVNGVIVIPAAVPARRPSSPGCVSPA